MSISKRLRAAGYKGPHPLASWADDPRAPAAVGNLGQLDHPESNRRIAERLLYGPVAPRPRKGPPDPGDVRSEDPEFAATVREYGLPLPAAITPGGSWYRVGSSFYRIGEGPFPKYLHPTGQIGLPWRQPEPAPDPVADDLEAAVMLGGPNVAIDDDGEPLTAGEVAYLSALVVQEVQAEPVQQSADVAPAAPPAPPPDVVRGEIRSSARRGRKPANGQLVFLMLDDRDFIERKDMPL